MMEAVQDKVLEVKNLSKSFVLEKDFFGKARTKLHAVSNINLEIYKGECLTLVGESGCGKSTLARLIIKLIDADQGEINFEGNEITKLKGKELRKIRPEMQMVFQNPFSSLDPRCKIFETIAEPLKVHWDYVLAQDQEAQKNNKESYIKKRVSELLELVDLNDSFLEKYPHQCSGGQNQRIGIARALALNPKLIIADEAVSALDAHTQKHVLELIKKLQIEKGISFLFITHDLSVVKIIADRVAVMYLGEIVELANCQDIFTQPLHPYSKALISAAPIADPKQRDRERVYLSGEIPKPTSIPSGCPFHSRCPEAIADCKEIKPNFEEKDEGRFASCILL